MSTSQYVLHQPNISPTFVGYTIVWSGDICRMQYLKRYGLTDPIMVKGTVCFLMVLATLETIFTNHQTYANFILSFGDVPDLNNIVLSNIYLYITSNTEYPSSLVPDYIHRSAFLFGMYMDSQLQLGPSLSAPRRPSLQEPRPVQVIMLSKAGTFRRLGETMNHSMFIIVAIQGGGTAACDVLITIILVYIFHATNTAAHRLFTYALNRAAATRFLNIGISFCAILTVFLYYYASGTYYFMIPALASTHLNVISIVSLISSRSSLRDKINSSISLSTKRDAGLQCGGGEEGVGATATACGGEGGGEGASASASGNGDGGRDGDEDEGGSASGSGNGDGDGDGDGDGEEPPEQGHIYDVAMSYTVTLGLPMVYPCQKLA
ncbi:hypothetical protein BDQ17DRAFT_1415001 [Cyathus striatus]|nr:hypothetical protein BDQ17DRAFT_1415001 [Cyathus striatus]